MPANSESPPLPPDAVPLMPPQGIYSTAIKVFHDVEALPNGPGGGPWNPLAKDAAITWYLCRAAREMAGVSHSGLWKSSGVSRKTINDFENNLIVPKISTVMKLRTALERLGVIFIGGESVVGVFMAKRHIPS